jgi:hypothetical protein
MSASASPLGRKHFGGELEIRAYWGLTAFDMPFSLATEIE